MSKINNQSRITSKYMLPDQTEQAYETQSNVSTTEYMTTSFVKTRQTEKTYGLPSDEILQTLSLQNDSEYDITNVHIKDTFSSGIAFKEGSLKIDDTEYPDLTPDGYNLPIDIPSGTTVNVTYYVVVDANPTVSSAQSVSKITYSVNEVDNLQEMSNEVDIEIVVEKISIVKTSSQTAVISGQKLTFQHVITNEGKTTQTDIMFYDPLPQGVKFIEDSVKIDNVEKLGFNPSGFKLDDLQPNASVTVTFEVLIEWQKKLCFNQ